MEIDLERLKTEGQPYVDAVIQEEKTKAWDNLRATKFLKSSQDEVDIMETIWSHGYMRGAEAASRLMMKIDEQSKKKSPLLWTPGQGKRRK